jgi:hypothetical protein
MKKVFLGVLAIVFSGNCFAQNTNVQQEVKTTVTTIKDSDGEKKIISTKELKEVQDVELKDAESRKINKEMTLAPAQITEKVQVTVDGVSRYVDKDRSGYYMYKGEKYQMLLDKVGYTIMNPATKKQLAVLRETSNNGFIVKGKTRISMGHFDSDGNLVIESYDEKTDSIMKEKAELIK